LLFFVETRGKTCAAKPDSNIAAVVQNKAKPGLHKGKSRDWEDQRWVS
jgi:hypothetical protein